VSATICTVSQTATIPSQKMSASVSQIQKAKNAAHSGIETPVRWLVRSKTHEPNLALFWHAARRVSGQPGGRLPRAREGGEWLSPAGAGAIGACERLLSSWAVAPPSSDNSVEPQSSVHLALGLALAIYAHAMSRDEGQLEALRALVNGADWAASGQPEAIESLDAPAGETIVSQEVAS
jgi:hypothetical protein